MSLIGKQGHRICFSIYRIASIDTVFVAYRECCRWSGVEDCHDVVSAIYCSVELLKSGRQSGLEAGAWGNFNIDVCTERKPGIGWSRVISFVSCVLLEHGAVAVEIQRGEIAEPVAAAAECGLERMCGSEIIQDLF